jgi:hypothetical protein
MAPSPTCLSCNRPFPRNGELASLPEGRRIAFDPGQRRVWRICTKCGEWNLLGAEAAGAALAELSAREPRPSASVRSTRVTGDLELLRIDDLTKVEVGDLVMAEQRDGLRKAAQFAPFAPLLYIGIYAISMLFMPSATGGTATDLLGIFAYLAGLLGIQYVPRIVTRVRYGASVPMRLFLTLAATQVAFLGGIWLIDGSLEKATYLYFGGLPAVLAFSLVPWRRIASPFMPQKISDVGITDEWDAMAIRWTVSPPSLALRALGGKWLPNDDSIRVLETAVSLYALKQTNAAGVQHAHALAASLGLSGVLAALDEWRHDRDDTLTLSDIPAVYLVALQLAFSREKGASKKALAAHERLLEAGTVAAEAEQLDREPTLPTPPAPSPPALPA